MSKIDALRNRLASSAQTGVTTVRHHLSRDWRRELPYLILALLLAVLFFFPFYWLIKVASTWPPQSLYAGTPSLAIENFELFNFVRVFYTIPFIQYLLNSFIITGLSVGGVLIFNSLAAYSLIHEFYGKRIVIALLIASMMIPYYVVVLPAYLVANELNLLNTYLGVAIPFMTFVIGILILKNSFEAVPTSMIEAARIDGASELYILFGVLWRLSKPALATNVILIFVFAWNSFLWPLVVLSDTSKQPLSLGLAAFTSRFEGNFALAYAFAIMALVPVIIMFVLLQRQFIRSVAQSALKE